MSCVMRESYGVSLRPAVGVLVVPYGVRLADSRVLRRAKAGKRLSVKQK